MFKWFQLSGRTMNRDNNRLYGRFRVLYSDGKRSEPMCYDVACDYAAIFKGTVIPK